MCHKCGYMCVVIYQCKIFLFCGIRSKTFRYLLPIIITITSPIAPIIIIIYKTNVIKI